QYLFLGLLFLAFTGRIINAQSGEVNLSARDQIARAVVRVFAETPEGQRQGSGTIVTPTGLIFTNFHVIDSASQITISIFEDFDRPPLLRYRASIIRNGADEELDFAVLQIDSDRNGTSLNVDGLNLPYIPVYDITPNILDRIYLFSYPLIAGGTLAITPGVITTRQLRPVNGTGNYVFYQSDAVFGEGASGGLAVNESNQFVGIPSEMRVERGGGTQLTTIIPIETICQLHPAYCQDLPPPVDPPADCAGLFAVNVAVGMRARVTLQPGSRNNVRQSADTSASTVTTLQPGEEFDILGGPVCADGYRWWEVRTTSNQVGWTADGDARYRSIEPATAPTTNTCPGLPSPIVRVGIQARVAASPDQPNNMRSSPDTSARPITQIQPGVEFAIIGGAVCSDGYRWWEIRLSSGATGWTADGDSRNRWIEPVN
ncbi:MAG: SH3 domain-containing protein, partial [Anaerolineae bacterium]|nr:SH3 domain-containing protein [Anaerolineae bacterium]